MKDLILKIYLDWFGLNFLSPTTMFLQSRVNMKLWNGKLYLSTSRACEKKDNFVIKMNKFEDYYFDNNNMTFESHSTNLTNTIF